MTSNNSETQNVVEQLQLLTYRHRNLVRMNTRMTNSIKGHCRNFTGELTDKGAVKRTPKADSLYKGVVESFDDGTAMPSDVPGALQVLMTQLLTARETFSQPREDTEKAIEEFAARLPVAPWVEQIKGVGLLRLGTLIGTVDPGKCENVAKFWFLLGIGIATNGSIQRKSDTDWDLYRYSPQRRALVWNIGDGIIRAQVRKVLDAQGEDTGERAALGHYGKVYLDRKQYELENLGSKRPEGKKYSPKRHAHNRAKRYMEKMFLRDLWLQWTGTPWVDWAPKTRAA